MTNNANKQVVEQPNPWGFDTLVTRLYGFVDSLEEKKRLNYALAWLGIAVALMVVASLPLGDNLRLVSVIVGWPSGVILFGLALAAIHSTRLKEMRAFQYKAITPPRQRVGGVIIGFIVIAVILIVTSSFLPQGVGGTIMVFSALCAYNIIRRTKEELALAALGLPDPRELPVEEEED